MSNQPTEPQHVIVRTTRSPRMSVSGSLHLWGRQLVPRSEMETQRTATTTTSRMKKTLLGPTMKKTLIGPAVFLDSVEVCAICIENMKKGDEARTLGCNHSFHTKCIFKWVERNTTCPMCRFDMCSRKRKKT
ncbi:hypothetical protein FRX31_028011 [Thalictrum thalictroides]|uniref:RING-type E3 ubiquitin transferase n=1 Tax=Thalictrum thalictroides TaxID=46969 RepID=A0A7J6VBD5_THATH|nr:hypothetical protein FRX31_028011 [Thalictrum thalictroides]